MPRSIRSKLLICCLGLRYAAMVFSLAEPPRQPKIAVIGGGAAGLASARVLSRAGYEPLVLEKEDIEGGVWKHRAGSRTWPVYRGLRTNLPKELMAYREFPWPPVSKDLAEDQSFLTHGQVLEYLHTYKETFGLDTFIQLGCKVSKLQVLHGTKSKVSPENENWPKIQLEWERQSSAEKETDVFDAVLVCNGHYAMPSIPSLSGAAQYFKGKTMHSIEYDDAADFSGLKVLCIGARASGEDLAREISSYSSQLFLSSSTYPAGESPKTQGKVTLVPRTVEVKEDGSVCFDGCPESFQFDVIIYCTGYDYSFPFIHDPELLQFFPGERRVRPLYEQVFHAKHPNLSFIGLPHSVVPFPFFEFQAEAIVAQFDDCKLPPEESRIKAAGDDAVAGGPTKQGNIQSTHHLGSAQWDLMRKMAKLAGIYDHSIENYIATSEQIYDHTGAERKGLFPGSSDDYREILYRRDDSQRHFSTFRRPVGMECASSSNGSSGTQK